MNRNRSVAEYRHKNPHQSGLRVLRGARTLLDHQMVPRARLELARLAARDFESRASTDSATGATHNTYLSD